MVTVEGAECGLQQMRDDLEDYDRVFRANFFPLPRAMSGDADKRGRASCEAQTSEAEPLDRGSQAEPGNQLNCRDTALPCPDLDIRVLSRPKPSLKPLEERCLPFCQ